MDRRGFIGKAAAASAIAALGDWEALFARGTLDPRVGKALRKWRKGQFQVHFIYTGAAESLFIIMPDGTTMLLDCGEQDTLALGDAAVPRLPSSHRGAGEWIARYVQRVNPGGNNVDYMMLSHYHVDHAGGESVYSGVLERDGAPWYLSGFSEAAEILNFGLAFDRMWPENDGPVPLRDDKKKVLTHMNKFYSYMSTSRGLRVERFRVGETNQVRLLRRPGQYPEFSVFNLCGNGRISDPQGNIIDLYERYDKSSGKVNENGLSLGMIFTYGRFKFYTAGDFSHRWKDIDGRAVDNEKILAAVVPPCQVSKLNHHGHVSMPAELVRSLGSKVWINSTWNIRHCTADTLARLTDRSTYPLERLVCPQYMPPIRREAAEAGSLSDLNPSCFVPGHIVLTVERGGQDYSISYVDAADESMTVRSVMRFKA